MASGSSNRPYSGSKGFDFASDDILCSYDDFANQDNSNGTHSDPSLSSNPTKDFQKSRISRSSVFPTTNVYSQPEESLGQEMISIVDRTMKKYTDNLMRFLEGISSRLSQLELYCYNLDKSIGEMRSELTSDNGDADSKLKSLEKNLQEVHRAVQILRDKQELAETQKELAKLQLAQKDSSSADQEDRALVSASETKKTDDDSDTANTQLALALPSQIAAQPSHPSIQQQSAAPPHQSASQAVSQLPPYYLPSTQLPNSQSHSQSSYHPADAQYHIPQLAPLAPQPSQAPANPQGQQYPQYQQQWPQQVSQPMQPPQQSSMPPPQQPSMQPGQQPPMQPNQIRPPSPQSSVYPPYMTSQQGNPPPEAIASSMAMQMPFQGIQQPGANRAEAMPYGYGGPGRPGQSQSSASHMKGGFPAPPGDVYATGGSHPSMSSAGTYMLYDGEGGRSHHPHQPSHYSQGSYPSSNPSPPNMPPPSSSSLMIRGSNPQQFVRSHPYNELIDKLVSMGYRGDHVVSVIQRLEESGQPVDFNAVLDRLNGHSSGSSQRSW